MFKLSEEAPAQHIALVAVAGVMIFLSLVDSIKGPSSGSEKQPELQNPTGSHYRNPKLSWYERVFCRGYQRSLSCGFSFYHPMRSEMEAQGRRIVEKEAPNGVVVFRGLLKGEQKNFGGKIEFDPD